jgi:tetratricopeptide (TPR) repeat protein
MKHQFLKLLLFTAVLFIPACGVWSDFTTYFNLYYNTSDSFQMAEEAIYLQDRSIFATQELSVPSSANQHLNKVIEKSSKILQYHANTSFVDNALLMLGKSFYYQKNYLKGLRKFQELEATQPGSKLLLENELWIAKTYMRLKEYNNALNTLDSVRVKAAARDEDKILRESYIEEVIYYLTTENYREAIRAADELFPYAADSEQRAEILFEIGNFYLELKEPENALDYYGRVNRYSPKYLVQLNSMLSMGRTLRELERNEEALEIFERMRLEDKYRDNYDVIDYEIGLTYFELDEIEEAQEALAYVDTAYTTSQVTGLARYQLGRLFEEKISDFDSASVYYQKAASSQLPADRVREIHGRNQLFQKHKELVNRLKDGQKQLLYIDDPGAFERDSTIYYDSLKALAVLDSIKKLEDPRTTRTTPQTTGRQTDSRTQPQTQALRQQPPPARPRITRDSVNAVLIRNKFDLANLYFGEMNKPDSAARIYSEILADTAASQYHSRTMYAMGNYYFALGDTSRADSIFHYIYDNFRTEQVANAAAVRLNQPLLNITYDPAEGIFAEAEKLWLRKEYDSALVYYKQVYEEFPKSSYAPKALLASGMILENDIFLMDSAAALYDTVAVRYPGTPFALKVSPKLIAYKQEQMKKQRAIEDSIRVANMKADSLKKLETPVALPDSLSEVDRLMIEMDKAKKEAETDTLLQSDTLKIDVIKPDTLQQPKPTETQERRNPRRR